MVVIHFTAMQGAQAALDRLCDPQAQVSAHYLIGADGTCWQMVDEAARAWHAGAGQWGAVSDVNSRSIGIELDNRGDHPFAARQMRVLEDLLAGILSRWQISPQRVIGHADMAPGRKADPGPRFDWRRLARQGLSVWPETSAHHNTSPDAQRALGTALHGFGYPTPPDCAPDDAVLAAFRARFGAFASLAAAQDLAKRFPVDRATRSA